MEIPYVSYTATTRKQPEKLNFSLNSLTYDLPSFTKESVLETSTPTKKHWRDAFGTVSESSTPSTATTVTSLNNYTPLIGDVVEINNPASTRNWGHAAIYTSQGWVSDYKLKTMDPYHNGKSTYRIFRNPNQNEAIKAADIAIKKALPKSTRDCAKYVRQALNSVSPGRYNGEGVNGKDFGTYLSKRGWTQVAKRGGILKAQDGLKWASYTKTPSYTPTPMEPLETLGPVFNNLPLISQVTNRTVNENAASVKYDLAGKLLLLQSLKPTFSFYNIESSQPTTSTELSTTPVTQTNNDFSDIEKRQEWAESKYNSKAKSSAGAIGSFLIMPITLLDFNQNTKKNYTIQDMYNRSKNKEVRDWLMNRLYNSSMINKPNQTDEVRWAKTLAAYNWGSGNLNKYLTKLKESGKDIYKTLDWIEGLPKETRDYVKFIVLKQDSGGHRTNALYNKSLQL